MEFIMEKLSKELVSIVENDKGGLIPVIVQMNNELSAEDESVIINVGGEVKSTLSIINGYVTELSGKTIKELTLNEKVLRISYDGEVYALY